MASPSHIVAFLTFAVTYYSFTLVQAQEWTPAAAGRVGYGETPVWYDEFNEALDTSVWTVENRAWPDNGELEFYSNDRKYVSTDSDGVLNIVATRDKTGGKDYTSGRLSTMNSFLFKGGLIAARIKMAQGQGFWPAFWMFGTGDLYSEFDIAELVGGNGATLTPPKGSGDDRACGTLSHFNTVPKQPVSHGPGCSHHLPGNAKFADDYHVFWMEWTPTEMWSGVDTNDQQKFVDDISKLEAFNSPMFIILNLAVGGDFPGAPDSTSVFPQTLSVDWVRVYAKEGDNVVEDIRSNPPDSEPEPTDSTGASDGGEGGNDGDDGSNPDDSTTGADDTDPDDGSHHLSTGVNIDPSGESTGSAPDLPDGETGPGGLDATGRVDQIPVEGSKSSTGTADPGDTNLKGADASSLSYSRWILIASAISAITLAMI